MRRTAPAGRPGPAGQAWADSPGSGLSVSGSLRRAGRRPGWLGWSRHGRSRPQGCWLAGAFPAGGCRPAWVRPAGRWRDGWVCPVGVCPGGVCRPEAGSARAGRLPGCRGGRVAAGRRAHPQNPWRERISPGGCHCPDRHFPRTPRFAGPTGPGRGSPWESGYRRRDSGSAAGHQPPWRHAGLAGESAVRSFGPTLTSDGSGRYPSQASMRISMPAVPVQAGLVTRRRMRGTPSLGGSPRGGARRSRPTM